MWLRLKVDGYIGGWCCDGNVEYWNLLLIRDIIIKPLS